MNCEPQIFLSPAAAAALLCRERSTITRQIGAGNLGKVIRRGRTSYVALAEIERVAGTRFSEAQITRVIGASTWRRLTIPNSMENV